MRGKHRYPKANSFSSLRGTSVASCAADPIRIESAPGCAGNEPPEQCLNADSRWKTIVTHEIGHVLQRRLTGRWRGVYEFAGGANDHPGAPVLCQCQHVSGINTLHCLQSLEKPGAAQVEGYAHYVVGRAWNALEQNDCVFPYYKQFLSTSCLVDPADCSTDPGSGLVVNSPPVARSCVDPHKWRNNNCLSGVFQPGEVPTDLTVEVDWMGFYYKLTNPVTANRFTVHQLADVYIATCALTTGDFCNVDDVEPGWRTIPGTTPPVRGIRDGAAALVTSGTITTDQQDQLLDMGNTYGVNEATSP